MEFLSSILNTLVEEASEIISLFLVSAALFAIYREARTPGEERSIWKGFRLAMTFFLISSIATVLEEFFLKDILNILEHLLVLLTAGTFLWFVQERFTTFKQHKRIYEL